MDFYSMDQIKLNGMNEIPLYEFNWIEWNPVFNNNPIGWKGAMYCVEWNPIGSYGFLLYRMECTWDRAELYFI